MSRQRRNIPPSYFDDEEQNIPSFDEYMKTKKQSSKPARELSTLDTIAIAITILLMAFWTLVILTTAFALRDPMISMGVLIGALAYWGITWIVYYVGWKFYWILIALGWLLGSAYALTIFGAINQMIQHLF